MGSIVTISYCYSGGISDPRITGSEGKQLQQLTKPYEPTLTSSSVNHLSHQRNTLFLSYYLQNQLKGHAQV